MAIESCPTPREDCPWFTRPTPSHLKKTQEHGCRSDLDHIVPRRLGTTALAGIYIEKHPENKQQLCRWEHDKKTLEGDAPLPDTEYMEQAIQEAEAEGLIHLSKKQRKRLGL